VNSRIATRQASILTIVAGGYVAAQILADVSSLKLIEVFGRAVDGGTLIYPLTFTLRDLVHKLAGKRVARTLIITAAAINLLMAGLFWLVDALPAVAGSGTTTDFFGDVLGPVWRIVIASIIAEVVAELIDTEVYAAWVKRFRGRRQWGRVLASNGVALPIDSVLFAMIAFAGVQPGSVITEIIVLNIVFKGVVTLASIPLIYTIKPDPIVDEAPLETV
jgi:uncharacterized integral membrane protein (TIGR00697 family)